MNGTKRLDGIMVGGTICKPADVTDLAARLLPFEGVDEHRIWPIGVYEIGNPGPMDWEADLTPVVRDAKSRSLFSYHAGTRAQAVEACRADLRIRLKAVDELKGVEP